MKSSYRLFLAVLVTASVWSCGGAGGGDPIGGGGGDGIGPLGCRLDEYSPNYLQTEDPSTDIPNDVHWWDSFPIRVYFANDGTLQGQQLSDVAMAGFNSWSSSAGQTLAVEVATESQADVVVSFQNVQDQPGGGDFVGQTSWTYSPSTRQTFGADMILRTWDGMTANQVANGLRRTAQHEFGHVLFLSGHSPNSEDTMYPFGTVNTYTALTEQDENSLLSAYCGSFEDRGRGRAPTGPVVKKTISCPAGH